VNSEVFDHTSLIRLIERRFGVMSPNITKLASHRNRRFDFRFQLRIAE